MKLTLRVNATDSDTIEMVTQIRPKYSRPKDILWGTFHVDMMEDAGIVRLLEEEGEVEMKLEEA